MELKTMTETAKMLGVDRRQIDAWDRRNNSTGFPGAIRRINIFGRDVRVWNTDEVSLWYFEHEKKIAKRKFNAGRRQKHAR